MKQYQFIEPSETSKEMAEVLVKGLGRALTQQEADTLYWLSECEYVTRGVILDLFKELSNK